jgi:peptide/nickel transport system substrate-binding protein
MLKRSKFTVAVLVMATLLALVVPAIAQEEPTGGVAVTGTFGEGPDTFSPIYCTGTDCADIVGYLFLGLVNVDTATGTIQPNQEGALAASWEVSEDNLTYTFTLKDIYTWSDGTPVTANDIIANWDLMNTAEVEHPDAFVLETIASMEAIDDYTLVVEMQTPACSALNNIAVVAPIPAHIYEGVAPADLATFDENLEPTVTSGAFTFGTYRPGELTTLLANKGFVDGGEGDAPVSLDGFIQSVYSDQNVLIEALLEGELNFLEGISPTRQDEIREQSLENGGELQIAEFPGTTWDYMAFNLADPENPQPAFDEDGNRIDQGLHPFFSDVMVRNAIGHAVNVDSIIEGAVFGNGSRMASQLVPASWAHDDSLEPRAFDAELALEMLAEAGWVPNDDGRLVCDGCLYAEQVDASFNGTEFEFTLFTNSGNTRREAIGTVVQDQLDQIGITVDFQTIEFNTLLEIMDSQSFDAFILGWRAGYPDDPNTIQLFGPGADVPGSGFNFTSFYNERYVELEQQANTVPGCDQEARAEIYAEMQQIMYDEMPYMWMFSQNQMYAAQDEVIGFSPFAQAIDWNLTTWAVIAEE